ERITVRGRAHDRFDADIVAATRPVLGDEWLAEPLREPLPHKAREDVGRAAGAGGGDYADWSRRIGLRHRDPRHGRQRGSGRRQIQELSAKKFYGVPPRNEVGT